MDEQRVPVTNQPKPNMDVREVSPPSETETIQFQAPQKEKKPGKGKKVLLALLSLLVLVGAAYGAYWYGQEQARKEADAAVAALQSQLNELKATSADNEKVVSIDVGESLSFTVLPGWTVQKESKPTSRSAGEESEFKNETTEHATFTSPSGDVVIKVSSGISGIGGACLEDDADKLAVFKEAPITGAAGFSYNYYVTDASTSDEPFYVAGLALSEDIKDASMGGSYCDVALSNYILRGKSTEKTTPEEGAYSVQVFMKKDAGETPRTDKVTREEVDTFFASEEFAQAERILLSLKTQ